MKNIYIAKLVWSTVFMPENVLVVASSIEEAIELIHNQYKEKNRTTFVRTESLQKLEMPIQRILTNKGEI